jgi:hypothetical protein
MTQLHPNTSVKLALHARYIRQYADILRRFPGHEYVDAFGVLPLKRSSDNPSWALALRRAFTACSRGCR